MNLLSFLLVAFFFVGALLGLLWLSNRYGSPLTKTITRVAVGLALLLAVIALLIWGLDYFVVLNTLSRVRVPGPRG